MLHEWGPRLQRGNALVLQLQVQARNWLAFRDGFQLELVVLAVADGDRLLGVQVVFAFLLQPSGTCLLT